MQSGYHLLVHNERRAAEYRAGLAEAVRGTVQEMRRTGEAANSMVFALLVHGWRRNAPRFSVPPLQLKNDQDGGERSPALAAAVEHMREQRIDHGVPLEDAFRVVNDSQAGIADLRLLGLASVLGAVDLDAKLMGLDSEGELRTERAGVWWAQLLLTDNSTVSFFADGEGIVNHGSASAEVAGLPLARHSAPDSGEVRALLRRHGLRATPEVEQGEGEHDVQMLRLLTLLIASDEELAVLM